MINGKPVTWTCPLKIECIDCGENIWCFSDEQLEEMQKKRQTLEVEQ